MTTTTSKVGHDAIRDPGRGRVRICVITAGHLATCPRMLKAADAFAEAGYSVRVVSGSYVEWAKTADATLRRTRDWDWQSVSFFCDEARLLYATSALRQRFARALCRITTPRHASFALAARGYNRIYSELLRAALAAPVDLFYGGGGALAIAGRAGMRSHTPFALDCEDFHSGEQEGPDADLGNGLARRIEAKVLPQAAFVTTGSDAIRDAYHELYGIRPITINNTFPLPEREPNVDASSSGPLKLYWFSQTVGPLRGLEEVVDAVALAGIAAELHVRGGTVPDYAESLRLRALHTGARLQVYEHPIASPGRMVELCHGYDVGLAVEQPYTERLKLALSNKLLTYILAGLAVAVTDTPGQRHLAQELGEGAFLYPPGNTEALAAGLRKWNDDRQSLARAKRACWEAAKTRWHWEHDMERGALLKAVATVVGI